MKSLTLVAYAILSAKLLPLTAMGQEAWTTVDTMDVPGFYSRALAIASAVPGIIIVVGREYPLSDLSGEASKRVVRKSTDSGLNWAVLGRFSEPPFTPSESLAISSIGQLFLVSESKGGGTAPRWVVEQSVDDDMSWLVADDWQYTPDLRSIASHIAIDTSDNIYIAGEGQRGGEDRQTWFVRQSRDGGQNWQLVDEWNGYFGSDAGAHRVLATSRGVLVGGLAYTGADPSPSYIRRSTDQGYTWDTIAEFSEILQDMEADANGNIYALFRRYVPGSPGPHSSILRRSMDNGQTWHTFPDLLADIGDYAGMTHLAVGQSGRLIVAGSVALGHNWVVLASDDDGMSWTPSDDFQGRSFGANISGLVIDAAGSVFGVGSEIVERSPTRHAWVVRKLSAVPKLPTIYSTVDTITLRLTWSTSAVGFTPQFATTLANGGDWQELDVAPTIEGDQYALTVERESTGVRFFRLWKP